ncbi:uncharacterized protein V1510DRAFT_409904 [Dipodascopsis tothii]|uniref:uncharacterized protein n=1 Tax=Dipodascopsis tothii TaxID=44089 RepID=UPI0034CD9EF7
MISPAEPEGAGSNMQPGSGLLSRASSYSDYSRYQQPGGSAAAGMAASSVSSTPSGTGSTTPNTSAATTTSNPNSAQTMPSGVMGQMAWSSSEGQMYPMHPLGAHGGNGAGGEQAGEAVGGTRHGDDGQYYVEHSRSVRSSGGGPDGTHGGPAAGVAFYGGSGYEYRPSQEPPPPPQPPPQLPPHGGAGPTAYPAEPARPMQYTHEQQHHGQAPGGPPTQTHHGHGPTHGQHAPQHGQYRAHGAFGGSGTSFKDGNGDVAMADEPMEMADSMRPHRSMSMPEGGFQNMALNEGGCGGRWRPGSNAVGAVSSSSSGFPGPMQPSLPVSGRGGPGPMYGGSFEMGMGGAPAPPADYGAGQGDLHVQYNYYGRYGVQPQAGQSPGYGHAQPPPAQAQVPAAQGYHGMAAPPLEPAAQTHPLALPAGGQYPLPMVASGPPPAGHGPAHGHGHGPQAAHAPGQPMLYGNYEYDDGYEG